MPSVKLSDVEDGGLVSFDYDTDFAKQVTMEKVPRGMARSYGVNVPWGCVAFAMPTPHKHQRFWLVLPGDMEVNIISGLSEEN